MAARNILVEDFDAIKIADFGLARNIKSDYYYMQKLNVSCENKSNIKNQLKGIQKCFIQKVQNDFLDTFREGVAFAGMETLSNKSSFLTTLNRIIDDCGSR